MLPLTTLETTPQDLAQDMTTNQQKMFLTLLPQAFNTVMM